MSSAGNSSEGTPLVDLPIDEIAQRIMTQCDALVKCSDSQLGLTRTFCSPAMKSAHQLVDQWMKEAGLETRLDEAANLVGRRVGKGDANKLLLMGSHLDSVVNAGRYDGPLGVLLGIGLANLLQRSGQCLPYTLDFIAFADEEGVRFDASYLGSRAMAGALTPDLLDRCDAEGISMREALRKFGGQPESLADCSYRQKELIGYVEVHIEQGPILESLDKPLGVVSAIAGQTRASLKMSGRSDHAGTTPMDQRKDALAATAQVVLAVEELGLQTPGLVATVGKLVVEPNAINVISDCVTFSLDVRHADEAIRDESLKQILNKAQDIANQRGVACQVEWCESFPPVPMDERLTDYLRQALTESGQTSIDLVSGAGHDAVYMSHIAPVAMFFMRCKGGVSHHPDESVTVKDVATALRALLHLVLILPTQTNERC